MLFCEQDILKLLMERGPQFSEHEYTTLLSLKHRSQRGARDEDLTTVLQSLSDILTDETSSVWPLPLGL